MLAAARRRGAASWRTLRFVVVDEAHTYRGVFGSHVALVLRRLRRVAALHGAAPTLLAASATIADPGTTAAALLGLDVSVVDVDDSTRGGVDIVLWNPVQPAQESGATDAGAHRPEPTPTTPVQSHVDSMGRPGPTPDRLPSGDR